MWTIAGELLGREEDGLIHCRVEGCSWANANLTNAAYHLSRHPEVPDVAADLKAALEAKPRSTFPSPAHLGLLDEWAAFERERRAAGAGDPGGTPSGRWRS